MTAAAPPSVWRSSTSGLHGAVNTCSNDTVSAGLGSSGRSVHGQSFFTSIARHTAKMPKVPSMVFDLELEESTKCCEVAEEDAGDVGEEVAALVHPKTAAEYQLRLDVEAAMPGSNNCNEDEPDVEASDLASPLYALGYRALIRTALGGGNGNTCLTNLRHTFLVCAAPGSPAHGATWYIVDPRFRESFEIAKPTARYAAALAAVPPVFVGTQDRLSALVSLLCAEMRDSFLAHGAVLPPWRQADSILSKWRPRRSLDESVEQERGSGGAAQMGSGAAGLMASSPRALARSASPNSSSGEDEWRCLGESMKARSPTVAAAGGRWWGEDALTSGGRRAAGGLSARLEAERTSFTGRGSGSGDFATAVRELPSVPAMSG